MGDEFVVERPKRPVPLVALPRGKQKNPDGMDEPPVLELFVEFSRATAGCAACDRPIPKGTTRVALKVHLRWPVVNQDGTRRLTERYYLHPTCITERVRPEISRSGIDCYDCGAEPPPPDVEGWAARHPNSCYTVSRFSPAPLCMRCTQKPRWDSCDVCQLFYPPWMISTVAGSEPKPEFTDPSDMFISTADYVARAGQVCGFCASKHKLITRTDQEQAAADFERLRAEIREHGFFEAGDDG